MKEKNIIVTLIAGLILVVACKQSTVNKANPLQNDTTQSPIQGDTLRSKNPQPDYIGSGGVIIFGEAPFVKPQKIKITDKLQRCISGKIKSAETVDFTGDKIPDFICKSIADTITGSGTEYWISSDYKIIKTKEYSIDWFSYRWFINLDEDPEPEIYETYTDEEFTDNRFIDQNLVTGKDSILLYINPVIIEDDKNYWGFAQDISNMMTRINGNRIELNCSLNHYRLNDHIAVDNIDAIQSQVPVVFFMGHSAGQKYALKNIAYDYTMLTLQELIKQTRK